MAVTIPPLSAHRFGREYGPDNSRQALERALSEPVEGVETDCCLTADGAVVLLHDPYLPVSVGLDGWAADRTAAELTAARLLTRDGKQSDQRPLLLEELATDPRIAGLRVQLDVKAFADPDLAARTARAALDVLESIDRADVEFEVVSFWPRACEVAASAGIGSRPIVACPYTPEALAAWAVDVGVTGVILEPHYWSRRVVEVWRGAGLSVMSGNVNDPVLAARVIEFAPDALSTDRPHELRRELAAL